MKRTTRAIAACIAFALWSLGWIIGVSWRCVTWMRAAIKLGIADGRERRERRDDPRGV